MGTKVPSAMEVEGRAGSSDFGILLRHHRLAAGLSQEALAERARMSLAGISALERGHRRTPQRETLALLAGALALDDEQRREFEAAAVRPPAPRRGGPVTVGPWPSTTIAELPLALTSFVGRETELAEISALVQQYRLITITGAGGVGKTQTALRVAASLSESTSGAICFVGLAPLSDPSLVAAAIAAAIGVQEVPDRPLIDTLIAYLKNKTLLLILDNCEHVIDEAANVVYKLLPNCPSLRIVATSRETLRTAGERAYRLPSLNLSDSVELFTDRACATDYRFRLDEENAAIVDDLCRRLDGIPLAIEMAAARMQTLTPRAVLRMLERRLSLLRSGDRTAPSRQQTMWATLDWSYRLLSKEEKVLFDRLAVFAGGCTLELATSVCADDVQQEAEILELLSSLVVKSLATTDHRFAVPRYRLLEPVRQYARERLAERGQSQLIMQRLATAVVAVAARFEHSRRQDPQDAWAELARAEQENVRTALRWTLAEGHDVLSGQRILSSLLIAFWDAIKAWSPEGSRWITLAMRLADEQTPIDVLAKLSYAVASVAWLRGDYEEDLAASTRAAELFRREGDEFMVAGAQLGQAVALEHLGRIAEAAALVEETVLPFAIRIKDDSPFYSSFLGVVLGRLAMLRALQNDLVSARRLIGEAKAAFERAGFGHPDADLFIADNLSWFEYLEGNYELALQYTTDALAKREGMRSVATEALELLPAYLVALARYDEAEQVARDMLELAGERSEGYSSGVALQHLAIIATERPAKNAEDAVARLQNAAQILGFVDARNKQLNSRRKYLHQLRYDRAIALLRRSLGEVEFTRLMQAGSRMSEGDAVALTSS